MSFPRYRKYKANGLDWLPQIPEHWMITPLKHVANLKGRLGWQGLRSDEYTEEGPYLVTSEHFTNDKVDWHRCHHVSYDRYVLAPEIQLRSHDLLVMKDGAAMGKLAYIDELPGPACLNSHLLLCRPRKDHFLNRFLYYVLGSPSFKTYVVQERKGTTFFGISQESIGAFPFIMPPLTDQQAIAAFLDRETAKIDALVDEQKRLIELLKEKRQAVISHAVTKGLDPNAPMKDSGVEWLGQVPEHWTLCSLGKMVVLQRGVDITKDGRADGMHPVVSSGGIDYYCDRAFCIGPGVLIGRKGSAGKLHFVECDYWPHDTTLYVKEFRSNSPIFVWYVLHILDLASFDTGSSNPTINRNRIHPMKTVWPSSSEQSQIVTFLDCETEKLDALIGEAKTAIGLLLERRSALISAAVTGKIDVRGVATEIAEAAA